ncbi:MAG TPA: amidohydrolase family protein [Vicinamibacteria bacterium]|nr:amidohydrolase family protein [Vicinamibacteria bacterium]
MKAIASAALSTVVLTLGPHSAVAVPRETAAPAARPQPAPPEFRKSTRSLASFARSNAAAPCYDRAKEPYTAVVDVHFHPRPFGGQAIPPAELFGYLGDAGVRFVNYFGIGQSLDMASSCTYYLDCPGTPALPSIKNDFVNGEEVKAFPHDNLFIVLSMTFVDLANPEGTLETLKLYDKEFPGMFKWAGELNVIKQALLGNRAEPATLEDIDRWAPFMKVFRERGIPVTLHSDLGNDASPTQFLPLMKHVLALYPDNKIVWAHMGLSKELSHMDPEQHVRIMKEALDSSPNLMLDISWDVLYEAYHEYGAIFVKFFNEYPDRILPGSDFVAARSKKPDQYAKEQEITSRVGRVLSDEAFRKIMLGENYFRLLNLDYRAPEICR